MNIFKLLLFHPLFLKERDFFSSFFFHIFLILGDVFLFRNTPLSVLITFTLL